MNAKDSSCSTLEGRVVCRRRCGSATPVTGLYVHPVTGLLRWSERSRRTDKPAPEPDRVVVSETLEYQKVNGLWFRLEWRHGEGLVGTRQCDKKTIRRIEAGLAET